MIKIARKRSRFIAWLLTAMLLWVSAAAVAHELNHALDQHQEPCLLHHYTGHHGGLPASGAHPLTPPRETRLNPVSSRPFVSRSRPAPYAVRAPPSV